MLPVSGEEKTALVTAVGKHKKSVLFATSGSSGFGNTANELKPSAPDAEIIEGKLIRSIGAERAIKDIITAAGLDG